MKSRLVYYYLSPLVTDSRKDEKIIYDLQAIYQEEEALYSEDHTSKCKKGWQTTPPITNSRLHIERKIQECSQQMIQSNKLQNNDFDHNVCGFHTEYRY